MPPPGAWAVGVVNHGSYDDLAECLASVERQTSSPRGVLVVDTGVDPARLDALRVRYPEIGRAHV